MNFDYSIRTSEERVEHVRRQLGRGARLTNAEKQYAADYILRTAEKGQTMHEKSEENPIITNNRAVTIDKRQISYEQVVASLENGEDGLHNLINNDKNQLLDRKSKLTQEDIDSIPEIREHLDIIASLTESMNSAHGRRKSSLKRQIIDTWRQIYIIRSSAKRTISSSRASKVQTMAHIDIPEKVVQEHGKMPVVESPLSLLVPAHVSFLLCNYSSLKKESYDDLQGDMHWLLIDLEDVAERALRDDPFHMAVLQWKVDGRTNREIKELAEEEFDRRHDEQYFSTIWRQYIPNAIANQAVKEYVDWYYINEEKGRWKVCGRCGKTKLAHPIYFSKNTSKDGFYSHCKECRAEKHKEQ